MSALIQEGENPHKEKDPQKEKEVDEEVFETQNINDDYDQINQEKLLYSKFTGSSFTQQSQHINQEPVNQPSSMKVFGQESNQSISNRFILEKSRQARIGNRLIQIR